MKFTDAIYVNAWGTWGEAVGASVTIRTEAIEIVAIAAVLVSIFVFLTMLVMYGQKNSLKEKDV